MNHKEWAFPRLRTVRLLLAAAGAVLALSASAQVRTIETPVATLRLSEETGDLIGLRWKSPGMEIIGERRLGENFRILLPQDNYQANYFNSRDQKVSRIEDAPDGVLCSYESLRNERETIPVKVRYRIQAVDGQIHFSIEVDNPTDRKLAEVMYGVIGGQKGIGDRRDTESMVPGANDNMSPQLFTRFRGGFRGGNFGIPYDAMTFTYPGAMSMGWIDIYNQKAGVGYYYANQDSETRLMLLNMELRPFGKGSDPKDDWPSPSELPAGQPIGMTMGWVNLRTSATAHLRQALSLSKSTREIGTRPAKYTARGSISTLRLIAHRTGFGKKMHGNPSFCPTAKMWFCIALMNCPSWLPTQRNMESPPLKSSVGTWEGSIADTRNTSPIRAWELRKSFVRLSPTCAPWVSIHSSLPMWT